MHGDFGEGLTSPGPRTHALPATSLTVALISTSHGNGLGSNVQFDFICVAVSI